ncbi:hypothetical protein EW146_g2119 [Bondarzewia mesenterica]|uniref:Uncharacterized protein n=1 Tax=Bondarzewia mesenterica TaxID=1095465 RepID=A0A4S4M3Z3_9AGAM|nr:hypothetical protein EW146_g2119 [Bondarzewia mesenterica]
MRAPDEQHVVPPAERGAARRTYAKVALESDDNDLRVIRDEGTKARASKSVVFELVDDRLVREHRVDELPPGCTGLVRLAGVAAVADVHDQWGGETPRARRAERGECWP